MYTTTFVATQNIEISLEVEAQTKAEAEAILDNYIPELGGLSKEDYEVTLILLSNDGSPWDVAQNDIGVFTGYAVIHIELESRAKSKLEVASILECRTLELKLTREKDTYTFDISDLAWDFKVVKRKEFA